MTTDLGHGRGWLADDAAKSVFHIDAALGRPLQITSAGRTKAENDALIARWNSGNRAGLTYQPSPTSPHLSGLALDTNDHAWMLAHGAPYGWIHDIPGDLVHFVYHANKDTHTGEAGSVSFPDLNPLDGVAAAINTTFGPVQRAGAWLTQPKNWVRVGIFTLGAVLLGYVAIKLFSETDAGQAITKTAESAVGTAAGVAAVVPK